MALIPSIDLQDGRVVQLVQGERLAVASDDVEGWVERFRAFPAVQLIDLDAAMNRGDNDTLIRRIAGALPCRVGGGVRSIARATDLLAAGARAVIVSSAFFAAHTGQDSGAAREGQNVDTSRGAIDHEFAAALAAAVGRERVIGAVDARGGHVVIHGWKTTLPLTPMDAVRELEPYCAEFLYTHVDREGLMQGTDMGAIQAVAAATRARVTAAGGITTREEIDALDALGIDAVVGMAIYTGALSI